MGGVSRQYLAEAFLGVSAIVPPYYLSFPKWALGLSSLGRNSRNEYGVDGYYKQKPEHQGTP